MISRLITKFTKILCHENLELYGTTSYGIIHIKCYMSPVLYISFCFTEDLLVLVKLHHRRAKFTKKFFHIFRPVCLCSPHPHEVKWVLHAWKIVVHFPLSAADP